MLVALDAFGPRSWTRPEATGFGRIPMATYLARAAVLPLDGEWSFALRGRPEEVTFDDLAGATDGWASIEVPGCWTMQGFDRPQYTNIQMPFPGPPPHVPGRVEQLDRGELALADPAGERDGGAVEEFVHARECRGNAAARQRARSRSSRR